MEKILDNQRIIIIYFIIRLIVDDFVCLDEKVSKRLPEVVDIYVHKGGGFMNWVYILEDRAAEPGEYVEHKATGEIKEVMSVEEDGAILHSVYMILGGCGDIDMEYWQLEDYAVLRRVTDPVFSIEEDSTL
jgi:hypothetical protein